MTVPQLYAKIKIADTKWASSDPLVVKVECIVKKCAGEGPKGPYYQAFTPKHVEDFRLTTLYICKLDENRPDGRLNPYHCNIGAISESQNELKNKRISWPVHKNIITEPDSSAVEDDRNLDAESAVLLVKKKRLGNRKRPTTTQIAANSISKQYLNVSRLPKAPAPMPQNSNPDKQLGNRKHVSASQLPSAASPMPQNSNADNVLEELVRLRAELEQTKLNNIKLLQEKEEQQRLAEENRQKSIMLLKEKEQQQLIHEETIRKVFADEMAKREAATATFWAKTLEREISSVKRDIEEIASKINDSICEYNPSKSYMLEWLNSLT